LGKINVSVTFFINWTLWESKMLQATCFILVESMPSKYTKAVFSIVRTVFG